VPPVDLAPPTDTVPPVDLAPPTDTVPPEDLIPQTDTVPPDDSVPTVDTTLVDLIGPDASSLPTEGGPMFEVINDYRIDIGLDPIGFSPSLTLVAQIHVADLNAHYYDFDPECNMHSWSDDGSWSSCCYTPDHAEAECMWYKPDELTNYPGYGYEIAAGGGMLTPELALTLWQGSSGHHDVIINEGIWTSPWLAMGGAIDGDFAVVWFGHETDPDAP